MKTPLYQQLYGYVRGEIEMGRLAPGARVPSEKELAGQFNVSRITSKRALDTLANEGVIRRARGRGSFVVAGTGSAAEMEPTAAAPAPVTGRPLLVGLLAPDISDTFGLHLARTVESQLRQAQIRTVFCRTAGQRELEEQAISDCLALGVAGLIIFPVYGHYYNERLLRLVLDHFPIVLVDRYLRGIPACSVCTDNRQAAAELVHALTEQGHQRFAFVSPPPAGTSSIEDRTLGVMAALAGLALPFDSDSDLIHTRFTLPGALTPWTQDIERDADILRAYVLSHPDVTAYLACEYPIALLMQRVLDEIYGAAGPYAIACFDAPATALDSAPFTHIRQDEEAMGCEAVRLLLAQLAGLEVPLHVATGYRLVRRGES